MKTPHLLITVLFLAFASLVPRSSFGQGALTPPPGAPAPTMKSLDQIEARTPIDPTQPGFALRYTISTRGSYYLTANLLVAGGNAIVISASNVTLDLNGFTISSSASPAGGTAIAPGASLTDIAIVNGHIAGSFQHGIRYSGALGVLKNVRVEGMSVSGCSGDGINLGNFLSIVIDHCTVQQAGAQGIVGGSVNNSVAENCGSTGITAKSANNCVGSSSASSRGIYAKTAVNCVGESATGTGLDADSTTGCRGESTALSSTGTGLNAATATGCYGSNSNGSGIGLTATSANACYGFSSSGRGLNATTALGCFGQSGTSGVGLNADNASNCSGISSSGVGLGAFDASNCKGTSSSNYGLTATVASNCFGTSTSFHGLSARCASNCYGSSSSQHGLIASNSASNCVGFSDSNVGLNAGGGTAAYCYGFSSTGVGLSAYIAIGCTGFGTPTFSVSVKYLMP